MLESTRSRRVEFVLVHGASHGAWCWYRLRLLLESCGYGVTCVDLACSGINPSDADSCFSFKDYNKPLVDFMATLPQHHKVIVVGHSAGGTSVSHIIHQFPHNLHAAVFVAAAMYPFPSSSPSPNQQHYSCFNSMESEIWTYGYGLGEDEPPTSIIMKPQFVRHFLYNKSPLEDVTLAKMLLRPCPLRALADATNQQDYESESESESDGSMCVPRVYIKTLHDNIINREREEVMLKQWPPSQLYEIHSDHSPFFSNPSSLFALLHTVATAFT